MATVIKLRDGSIHTIFDQQDAMDLIAERLGDEVLDWVIPDTADAEYIQQLETENADLRAHHQEVMRALRALSETEAKLIQEKEINREALSSTVGMIGTITWRELR